MAVESSFRLTPVREEAPTLAASPVVPDAAGIGIFKWPAISPMRRAPGTAAIRLTGKTQCLILTRLPVCFFILLCQELPMMPTVCRSLNFVLAIGLTIALCDVQADDKPAQNPKLSGWQRLFRKQSAGYKVIVEGDDGGQAKLVPEPLLQWNQPVRGGADGAVFVWTREGRPVAIGTMFIYPIEGGRQGLVHELHSLSQSPFVATWRDRRWTPPQASIVWNRVPDAPAPAAKSEQRLRQMRDLARQFSAESHDKNDRRWDLRCLVRPIFRYDLDRKEDSTAADDDVLDGALFGFVEGTDLEIVLSFEARKTSEGYRWEYALSRMSDFRLVMKLADKTVWEAEPNPPNDNPRQAYYCSRVETRSSADEE